MTRLNTLLLLLALTTVGVAQPPEYIWYDFNLMDGTNFAVPGVGNGTADPSLTYPAQLCFGDPGCASSATGNQTQIDSGWPCTLGSGDWTVGMHLDLTAGGGTANYFQYLFGCSTAGSFRCFVDGAAGNGNIILRGPMTDVIITGGGNQTVPVHVAWVYDSSIPEIRGYLDGVLNVTVGQSALTINGTTNFTVMRYNSSSSSAQPGVVMDDFRFYSRAIDVAGVGAGTEMWTWVNACGGGSPPPVTYQSNQPELSTDIDGASTNGYRPAIANGNVGNTSMLNLSTSLPSIPMDTAVIAGPLAPDVLVFPASMQRFNLDPFNSSTLWVSGFTFPSLPGGGTVSIPITPVAPVTISTQSVGIVPSRVNGIVVSQGNQFEITADNQLQPSIGCIYPNATTLTLSDDSFSQQALSFGFPFFGTTYSECFVGSNGHITFGSGNTGWASGQNGLTTSTRPIIAPCSEDFNPSTVGSVTFVEDVPNQAFEVCWVGVPSFGTSNTNTFSVLAMAFNSIQFNYDVLQDGDGTVGLGAGSNLNAAWPVNFTMAGGANGPLTVPAMSDPVEDFTGNNDLQGFQITFLTDPVGNPIVIF